MYLDSSLFTEIEKSLNRFEVELKALLKDIDEGRIVSHDDIKKKYGL